MNEEPTIKEKLPMCGRLERMASSYASRAVDAVLSDDAIKYTNAASAILSAVAAYRMTVDNAALVASMKNSP